MKTAEVIASCNILLKHLNNYQINIIVSSGKIPNSIKVKTKELL